MARAAAGTITATGIRPVPAMLYAPWTDSESQKRPAHSTITVMIDAAAPRAVARGQNNVAASMGNRPANPVSAQVPSAKMDWDATREQRNARPRNASTKTLPNQTWRSSRSLPSKP